MKNINEKHENEDTWYGKGAEQILKESMNRGSTDNISVMVIGLNDPTSVREAKKGNQNIKILSSINNTNKKRMNVSNKENSYPQKMRELDSKIMEINRNASKISLQPRRS